MGLPTKDEIVRLSVQDRIRLIEEVWDSITDTPETLPVTDAQRAELDRRLAADAADPAARESWETVRERLRRKA